jgi:hypothetical protein
VPLPDIAGSNPASCHKKNAPTPDFCFEKLFLKHHLDMLFARHPPSPNDQAKKYHQHRQTGDIS